MADIEVLKRQFEDAAKQYPGLRHTIVQRSKEGLTPETTALEYVHGNIDPDADYYVYRWGEHIDREPNEKGYPSWHFLSRPSPQGWSVRQAEGRALVLAGEAGKFLIALPELKGLTIDDPAELWFLALHRIYPCTQLAYDPPATEFDPECPRLKLRGRWREAKPGETYIEELDNVFLKSATLCEKLLISGQKPAPGGWRWLIGWIFKKTSHFICAIVVAVIATIIAAIIVDIFADFGWIERIKGLFTK